VDNKQYKTHLRQKVIVIRCSKCASCVQWHYWLISVVCFVCLLQNVVHKAAVIGLTFLGQTEKEGAQQFSWTAVLTVLTNRDLDGVTMRFTCEKTLSYSDEKIWIMSREHFNGNSSGIFFNQIFSTSTHHLSPIQLKPFGHISDLFLTKCQITIYT
jgi:hypothetical protein